MWEAERKQIKYLYLAAAIMLATLTLVIILVRLGVWRKGRGRLEPSSPLTSSTLKARLTSPASWLLQNIC